MQRVCSNALLLSAKGAQKYVTTCITHGDLEMAQIVEAAQWNALSRYETLGLNIMTRYEQTSLGDPENNFHVAWTTRDSTWPFKLVWPNEAGKPPMELRLTTAEARDLALFLTKYLLEDME